MYGGTYDGWGKGSCTPAGPCDRRAPVYTHDVWSASYAHRRFASEDNPTLMRTTGVFADLLPGEATENHAAGTRPSAYSIGAASYGVGLDQTILPFVGPALPGEQFSAWDGASAIFEDGSLTHIRESIHDGQPPWVFLTTKDDAGAPGVFYRVRLDTSAVVMRYPTEGVRAPISEQGDGFAGNFRTLEGNLAGGSSGAGGTWHGYAVGDTAAVLMVHGFGDVGLNWVYWMDWSVGSTWIRWSNAKRYKAPANHGGGLAADRNMLAAVCLNDAPRALAYNYTNGNVYRVNWTGGNTITHADPSDQFGGIAKFALTDPQLGDLLHTFAGGGYRHFWAYTRKADHEVFLVGSTYYEATHYYDSRAGGLQPLHPDDIAAGRSPTDICIGPDHEVVYGSSKFLRRIDRPGCPGWAFTPAERFGTSPSLSFRITANLSGYHVRGAHWSPVDATGLADPLAFYDDLGCWVDPSDAIESWQLRRDTPYDIPDGQGGTDSVMPQAIERLGGSIVIDGQSYATTSCLAQNWKLSRDGKHRSCHRQRIPYGAAVLASPHVNNGPPAVNEGVPLSRPAGCELTMPSLYVHSLPSEGANPVGAVFPQFHAEPQGYGKFDQLSHGLASVGMSQEAIDLLGAY